MSLRQETITRWIDGVDKNDIVKPYFYLEWDINYKMLPEQPATWYHKIPPEKKVSWRQVIKIGYREVSLCASFVPVEAFFSNSIYDSFLQSHLQKAVRRKNKKAAIFTADLLLELSPLKLLRRLPIILIEDTFVHKSLSTLIWLMCALSIKNNRKGLHENQKRWILGVVYIMSVVNIKEDVDHNTSNFVFSNHLSKIHKIKNKHVQDIIYSLETRRCYGGLKNDDCMFQSFENKYINIFLNNDTNTKWENLFLQKVRPILLKKTTLKQNEWLMEGYDFHCQPLLLRRLEEEFPEYDQDEHKRTIWYKSSGINFRTVVKFNLDKKKYFHVKKEYIPENITNHWNKIRRFVRRKAWGYVQGMLENLHIMFPDWIDYVPYEPPDTSSSVVDNNEDNKKNDSYDE
jgi:hypothetical protein